MRRLETDSLVVYYPDGTREEALRVTEHIAACTRALRERTVIKSTWSTQKPRIVLPPVPLNNASVYPPALSEPIGVVPTYATSDMFAFLGLPPDPAVVGCHEMVHYVQALQAGGFDAAVSDVLGPIYTPQSGLESWFQEGLAVYYETRLQAGAGRLGTRYFEGILAAGVADEGIDSGMTNILHREPLHDGAYLIGSAFIDWLIAKHGETDLFRVISKQGRSVLFPLFVETRFRDVYHQSLTSLFNDFRYGLQKKYPRTPRPEEQKKLLDLGTNARWTRGKSGHEAIVTEDLDQPIRLVLRAPNGTVLEKNLTDVLAPRTLVEPVAQNVSGLSFTPDGSKLYFVLVDRGALYQESKLVVVDTASGDLRVVFEDLRGSGGSIAPDGHTYYFARASGDAWGVAALDLASKGIRWVRAPEPAMFHTGIRVSPDGKHLLVTRSDRKASWLAVLDTATGRIERELTPKDETAMTPDWVDDDRIVYVLAHGGRMQVHVTSKDGKTRVVTRAPYLALVPQSDGRTIRFLNRSGWRFSLDEVPFDGAAVDARDALPPSNAMENRETVHVALRVRSDAPYSSLEHVWVPQARGLWLEVRSANSTAVGVSLNGGDPLGHHRWGIAAGYDTTAKLLSGEVGYINAQLAPLLIGATAAHYGSREMISDTLFSRDPATTLPIDVLETTASLDLSRTFYDSTQLTTGLRYDAYERRTEANVLEKRQFAGYSASALYSAAESTPYTGPRRAFAAYANGTMFPKLADADFALGDATAFLAANVPLLFKRLIVGATVRGRYLAGAPHGAELLQVGGGGGVAPVLRAASNGAELPDIPGAVLPPGLRFTEGLAGYEDLAHFDRGVAMGEASLRYPLIADWGSLSTFYLFPSFFFRQLDLVAFADDAYFVDRAHPAAAAGGRAIFRLALLSVPFAVQVQVAKRLADDEKVVPYLAVTSGE